MRILQKMVYDCCAIVLGGFGTRNLGSQALESPLGGSVRVRSCAGMDFI
jgi:hypothetical protein